MFDQEASECEGGREGADTICVRLPRSTCLALKSETAESAIATTRKTILKGNDECGTELKRAKWRGSVSGRAAGGIARTRWSHVCLALAPGAAAAVFRDLTPFASAVQTHNPKPYLATAKALSSLLSTPTMPSHHASSLLE